MAELKITAKAEDRAAGLNLGAVYAFAQEALNAGIDPRSQVKSAPGFRQQTLWLSVEGDTK